MGNILAQVTEEGCHSWGLRRSIILLILLIDSYILNIDMFIQVSSLMSQLQHTLQVRIAPGVTLAFLKTGI